MSQIIHTNIFRRWYRVVLYELKIFFLLRVGKCRSDIRCCNRLEAVLTVLSGELCHLSSIIKDSNRDLWRCYVDRAMTSSCHITIFSSAVDTLTNTKVAIKKLNRPFQTATHAKRTFRELRLLKHMSHENIIGLLDTFYHGSTLEEFQNIYLVTHLMGADLNNIIRTQRLTDDHVQFLVYQMLRGLKYIHSAGVIHRWLWWDAFLMHYSLFSICRDLKPSNLAVNEDCELRILDFGLARPAESEMTGYVATRWYRAPEIMLNWMHYNMTVDVWSVGCIMAELLTGRTLFPGSDRKYLDNSLHLNHLV